MMKGFNGDRIRNKIGDYVSKDDAIICSLFLLCGIIFNSVMVVHLGPDSFIDSFRNPIGYTIITTKSDTNSILVLIQKTTHPDFRVQPDDELFYLTCSDVYKTNHSSRYIHHSNTTILFGKIIARSSANPLDVTCFYLWDFFKENTNPYLFIKNSQTVL